MSSLAAMEGEDNCRDLPPYSTQFFVVLILTSYDFSSDIHSL